MKKIASKLVYQNRWMSVREDIIERADGSEGIYGVVDKMDFVAIIAIEDDHIYLVEQFRYPVQARFWEIPQGAWEHNADAHPEEVARGELKEETGLIAGNMQYLGHVYEAYGFSTQGMHVFLATDLVQSKQDLEPEEQGLIVGRFKLAEFQNMIAIGQIKDAATVAAFALWRVKAEAGLL